MRLLAILFACSACGASSPPAQPSSQRHTSLTPECAAVAQHLVAIGPADKWIAELREDDILPVDGASDRDGLVKFVEVGCQENWDVAQRRCVAAQATWGDVLRECSNDKVWWYQPT